MDVSVCMTYEYMYKSCYYYWETETKLRRKQQTNEKIKNDSGTYRLFLFFYFFSLFWHKIWDIFPTLCRSYPNEFIYIPCTYYRHIAHYSANVLHSAYIYHRICYSSIKQYVCVSEYINKILTLLCISIINNNNNVIQWANLFHFATALIYSLHAKTEHKHNKIKTQCPMSMNKTKNWGKENQNSSTSVWHRASKNRKISKSGPFSVSNRKNAAWRLMAMHLVWLGIKLQSTIQIWSCLELTMSKEIAR